MRAWIEQDRSGLNKTQWTKLNRKNFSGQNGLNKIEWTDQDGMDRIRPKWTEEDKMD